MAKAANRKLTLKAPGRVLDRAAKKRRLALELDPTPMRFLGRSIARKLSLPIRIIPVGENKGMEPIELVARVKSCVLKLEDCLLADPSRLSDLDYLVNDEKAEVETELTADPQGELFEEEDENQDENEAPGPA